MRAELQQLRSMDNKRPGVLENNAPDLAEIEDRLKRRNNVIVFNIPESDTQSSEYDMEAVKAHVGISLSDELLTGVRHFRLGKRFTVPSTTSKANRPRPVKILLYSPEAALRLLKFRPLDRTGKSSNAIKISSDKTPKELAELKDLREELVARTLAGEPNLSIRYINNVPTIVTRPHQKKDNSNKKIDFEKNK